MIKRIIFFIWMLVCCVTAGADTKHTFTLVIDAGHGGKDAGARGKYSYEKNINLNVALAFGRYVEQNCPDVKVIYTRKTDVWLTLNERANIANRNKADVFISIHTNAVASRQPVTGLETYTMGMRRSDEKLSAAMRENEVVLIEENYQQNYAGFDPRSPESYIMFDVMNDANMLKSIELAKSIQTKVCHTANRPNKGVKQDVFLVLRETSMPACLVELGYITTPSEENYLNNKKNIDALGRGIYQAFVEYKSKQTQATPKITPPKPEPAKPAPTKQEPAKQTPAKQEPAKQEPAKSAPAPTKPEPAKPDSAKSDSAQQSPTPPINPTNPIPPINPTDSIEAPADSVLSPTLPIFKVQFMASDRQLQAGAREFKGLTDVDCYQEGPLWKYTVGASADYNQIRTLRKSVAATFPQAFIVAFRNGERIDTQAAIQEWRQNQ